MSHAGEALDRAHRDEDADERQEAGLGERGEVLGFAVTELVLDVGRPRGDANREVGKQRSDEVGARVGGLRDEAEAVRRKADAQLEHDEDCRRGDGDEC